MAEHAFTTVEGFKERMAAAMVARGFTQAKVAKLSGVAQGQIWHWLHGTYEPRLPFAVALARTLGVSLDWLVGFQPAVTPTEMAAATSLRPRPCVPESVCDLEN
jgi:transcriptional regulator with XRE-family HTH domain